MRIENIRYQVAYDNGHGQKDHCSLDDWIVAVLRRCKRCQTYTRNVEDIFEEKCACDNQTKRETEDSNQGDERIT